MIRKSKLYTATGDPGPTSLAGGTRVAKDAIRIEAYGSVDELNAFSGLLANTPDAATARGLDAADVERLERAIDLLDAELPPLSNFVLPGGSRISSMAHVCRAVARRAERRAVALAASAQIDSNVLVYLNRLSDYFFALARFNNIHNQIEENFWDKDCK